MGAEGKASRCDAEAHCITCNDDGTAMTVLRVDTTRGLALCADAEGAHRTVEVELVGPVSTGDTLLVHADTAIALLDRVEAAA
jgi:hydrogenase maturation factor